MLWPATVYGAALLEGATAWLDFGIYAEVRAGDHDMVVSRVHDFDADHELLPLVCYTSPFPRLELPRRP